MKAIKNLRRAASLMLALVILLTMFPVQGTAEEIATPSDLPTAEETVQEEVAEDTATPDAELLPDSTAPPEEDAAPNPSTEEEQDTDEQPVSLKDAIAANGFAYVPNLRDTKVYNTPDLTEDGHIFTLTRMELVLLATDYLDNGSVEVWFLVSADAAMHGYVSAKDLAENAPTAAELDDLTYLVFCKEFTTSVGVKPLYLVYGDFVEVEEPTHGETEPDVPAGDNSANDPTPAENPSEEQPADENATPEDAEAAEPVTDADAAEELPDDYIDPSEMPEPDPVEVGSYVTVTTQTRVFSDVDVTAGYDYIGDLYQGYFVEAATVRVEAAGEDCCGRWWYEVTYLYGDTYTNGKLKWTATDRAIVLARETTPTDSTELTVTDYAFPKTGIMMMSMAEAPSGFTLKRISGPTGSFYVGQDNLHGSSGRDAEYKQIATLEGHGKIYATPHFLEGYVVYCLEHTLPGPGENISGGGKQPTGPYLIVDWESYQITDGYSGAIYGEDTMHGIAWVLAHGYPFMVLDRSDSDNETWSRVATQFAIREVIKQMEGAQYVRDYWQMDNFYAASNNAPAVYLEYARWLARNGIAHARRTGEITVSNKMMGVTDSGYFGSTTLTTDADLMRISKDVGTITGNTAGDDDNYYYLNSGDTITIYTTANSFAFKVESMADDEADFLVGVPDAAIQKVLIPIEGDPYPMKEIMLDFRIEHGAIMVTKTDTDSGMTLSGATFALLDSAGSTLQTAVTDSSGTATFSNIKAGQYQVQEIGAPIGYLLSVPSTQAVTVTAGATARLTFANEQITSKIRIVKTDAQTGAALPGAVFTVTDANGSTVATLTTGSDGTAVTGWLPYGTYTVTETAAPAGYINGGFSTVIDCHEDGQTYTFDVVNEPMQGGIRIVKTDALDGHPIAGVTFDIYQGGTQVGSMTTNSAGVAVSESLEPGSYTVKERALPNGYTGDLVTLDALVQSDTTTELSCTNTPIQGKAKIIKTNALTGAPLAGATFTITDSSGKTVATLTTAADGTAQSDWLMFGTYTVAEVAAPENFINAGFSQTFDVSEDGKTYSFEVANGPMQGGIKLVKTDAISGKPIAGVTFDIYLGSTLIGSMTTNDNGVAVSEALDPGTYTVRERELPLGYVGELVELEVVVESQVTAEVAATNTPSQSRIKIIKTDSLTETLLPGATFTITDESGALAATLTTGTDGMATSDWLPYGTYIISETAAPEHYVNSGFCQTVYAHENGKTYEFAVENAPTKGGIRLTKTDALDGRPIAGVTFDIYLGDQMVASMTTNESGVAVAPDLEKGIYTIREVALPEGYTGALVELTAEVQSDHTTELSCTNTPIQGKVRIEKKDSLTGEALAGATFTISDANGSIVETLTTGADGSAESSLLRYGEYTIQETAAPEHYVNSGFTETFFVSEEGKTYTFQVENAPTLGGIRLTKTDALDGRPLSGVVFDIYQGETMIGSMTTDEQGVASYADLNPGSYTVRERGLPIGYTGVLVEVIADVQSDEITELSAVNHPIQGKVKVIKVDSLTGTPLSGAIFTLTDANGQTVATLTTGADGMAESELLRHGTYTLTETAAPENYINPGVSETVIISEHEKTYTYEIENVPVQGWLRLSKTDALNGKPMLGVTFDVWQGDNLVTSMTTNAEGVAISDSLYPGSYTVRERELPIGYAGELVVLDAAVTSANTTELTCTNMPSQSKIKIVKTDSLTHEALPGAEFTVTDAAGAVVVVLTTGTDGTAESGWLRYGLYTVKETLTPAHYVPSSYMTTIEAHEDGKTYILDVENEPTKGFVEIVKIDELTRTPIAGVTFDIYQGDKLVSTMTTNANGAARSEALHKGQYTVREHENPTGYVDALSEQATVVRSDETTYLTATNMPIQGRIQIVKTDELTGEKLAGAEFTITRISGIPTHNGAGDGEVVATITTDAEGMAITPLLTWGIYLVEETTVPAHYVDNAFSVDVTITNDLETVMVEVANEPAKGWLRLTKTDRVNGNPIPGVQFDIYQGNELVSSMTTDENGVALSEPLHKGQYIVREHGAVDGYVYEEIRLDATVKSDEITELTATNQPVMTRIKLYKRDVDEYDGRNPNASLETRASSKLPKAVTIEAPETRGDGVLTGTVLRVSAGEDIVDRQGNILYPQGTVIIESLTTAGEDASVETELLWPGLYAIQEVAAPTGYQIDPNPFYVDTRSAAYQSETAVVLYNGLSLNEIKYGAISIVKILGANGADPDPTRVETPEKGAKFRVYLKSAGSYDNARKTERDTLTTDAHGYAMTKPLPYGVYVLEQIAGKEGYEIKGPIEFEITGEESLVNPPPITLSDQPILHRLKLIKTDAKTGKIITLANTSFKLKDSEGNYVTQTAYYPTQQTLDTFTTDESGTVTLPETVTWGLYHIEEVHAPEGYLIRTESLAVMIGHSGDEPGQTYELDIAIPNEPVIGCIRLEKRGMQLVGFQQAAAGGYNIHIPIYEDRYLAGAVFEVRAAEDIVGQEGTVWYKADQLVQTITTTDTGSDMSMELPLGRYYLLEVKAPEGYILADTPYEADLTYVDDKTPVVEITVKASNAYLPAEVLLTKEKEVMQTSNVGDGIIHQVIATVPGEGCVFGIFNAKDIRYPGGTLMADSLLATGVTDENGKLTFSGVYPHGDYYIKELSAPDGWKVNPTSYPISIIPSMTAEDAAIIRIPLNEPICNEIVHTPITLTKTDVTGAHTVPGALIEVENSSGNIIYRAYTDENGEIPDIPVIPGDYIFREVLAPEGYALNTAEMAFSVDAAGNVTGSTTIRDDYTRVTVKKVDLNGEPLEGVGFGLYRSGKLLATSYSDADGIVTFAGIPYGDYIIRETRPLSGYMLSDVQVRFSVDGTFVNPTDPLAIVENNPIEVILRKVDKDNKPLAGAVFALVDDTGAQVMTALSDETGTVKFTYVPYGSYTIQEIEAPTGYLLSRESIPVVIDKNYQNSTEPLATLVNQAKRLSYIKIDTSRKPLPGVVFDLVRADTGEIVESVTSNEWGEFIFTRFDYGEWIIREVAAPEGFNRMDDLYLVVDAGWVEPEPIFLVNIPNHYEFVKTDHEGNPMAGVKFTLEDAQGNILRDLVSGEDGIVHVTDLAPGSYTIREIETLEGFTRTEETIQIVISEQYIVPDEMFRLVNYPIIQTGAGIEMGPLMWIGAGLAGCSVLMLLFYWYLRRKYRLR